MTSSSSRRLFGGSFTRFCSVVLAGGILASSLVGCYGNFKLTNAVYRWNGTVTESRFGNAVIFAVLVLLTPVYGICMLVDAIVINTIEFWTGEPLTVAQTFEQPDGTTVVFAPGSHADEAILTVYRGDEVLEQRTYVRQGDGTTHVLDADKNLAAVISPDGNGGFNFTDATGNTLGELSSREIAQLAAAH